MIQIQIDKELVEEAATEIKSGAKEIGTKIKPLIKTSKPALARILHYLAEIFSKFMSTIKSLVRSKK